MVNELLTKSVEELNEEINKIDVEICGVVHEINTIDKQIQELTKAKTILENKKDSFKKLLECILKMQHVNEI